MPIEAKCSAFATVDFRDRTDMAENSLVEKSKHQFSICNDDSELFEIFVFDQVLKEYEPSVDDLETGWTDGGNDGGIDGFFVFVDHQIGKPDSILSASKRNPKLDVFILSVRKTKRFEQLPVDTLISSLGELLDLTIDESELKYPYNETVLQQREILKLLLTGLADRRPQIKIRILYCSRGDASDISPNVLSRGTALSDLIKNLFSNADIKVAFLGAAELLALARKPVDFTIRLPFSETYISREGKNYVFLCTLLNYYKSIIDNDGKLKRYLFESNVRAYLGQGSIAADIAKTLHEVNTQDQMDFWWLNNGVTIIGTRAYIVAKEILIENAQIVNGLQTTETLSKYFSLSQSEKDDRAILIKVLSLQMKTREYK